MLRGRINYSSRPVLKPSCKRRSRALPQVALKDASNPSIASVALEDVSNPSIASSCFGGCFEVSQTSHLTFDHQLQSSFDCKQCLLIIYLQTQSHSYHSMRLAM